MLRGVDPAAKRSVLIADDEPLLRRLMERILRADGFDVVSVGDGDSAVAEATRDTAGALAAIVLDVGMPPRGGTSALRDILERRPGLGFVVTSGLSPDAQLRDLLDARGGVFLPKPFAPDALVRAVHEAAAAAAVPR